MTFGKCFWILAGENLLCWVFISFFSCCEMYLLSSLCAGLRVLIFCLFFSHCRWWAGKKQSANIIWVCMTATTFIMFTVSMLLKLCVLYVFVYVFTLKQIVQLFWLKYNKVWLESLSLFPPGRLANNDLLSLDPFSPSLAAGSSFSASSSTGNR